MILLQCPDCALTSLTTFAVLLFNVCEWTWRTTVGCPDSFCLYPATIRSSHITLLLTRWSNAQVLHFDWTIATLWLFSFSVTLLQIWCCAWDNCRVAWLSFRLVLADSRINDAKVPRSCGCKTSINHHPSIIMLDRFRCLTVCESVASSDNFCRHWEEKKWSWMTPRVSTNIFKGLSPGNLTLTIYLLSRARICLQNSSTSSTTSPT